MRNAVERRVSPRTVILALLLLFGGLFPSAWATTEVDEGTPVKDAPSLLFTVMGMLDGVSMNSEPAASPFQPPGHGGTPPGLGGTPPGLTTPPGLGGTPPGQAGTAPGQENDDEAQPEG